MLALLALAACAPTPQDGSYKSRLTLIVWPKIGSCDFGAPDRDTAKIITYADLHDSTRQIGSREVHYVSRTTEPFVSPGPSGDCLVMARDVNVLSAEPDARYGFELHPGPDGRVVIIPGRVEMRDPLVPLDARRTLEVSAVFQFTGSHPGEDSATLDLGRIGLGTTNAFRTTASVRWPGDPSRLTVTISERSR